MIPTPWTPTADLDDVRMAGAAAKRSLVQLDDGRIYTLVRWPLRGGHGRQARCATSVGTAFTINARRIVAVRLPPSP